MCLIICQSMFRRISCTYLVAGVKVALMKLLQSDRWIATAELPLAVPVTERAQLSALHAVARRSSGKDARVSPEKERTVSIEVFIMKLEVCPWNF